MAADLFAVLDVGAAGEAAPFVCVYKITNKVTGAGYIGITRKGIEARFSMHWKASKREDSVLYRAMRKYGRDAFKIEVLIAAQEPEHLGALEQRLIKKHKTFVSVGGYNMTHGGEGSPGVCDITRERMRSAAKERMRNPETRKKIAASLRGNPVSIAQGYALSQRNIGRRLSPEHKKNLSIAHTGCIVTAETRAKISASSKGRLISEETRKKLSAALKGRTVDLQTRQKISAGLLRPEVVALRSAIAKDSWKGPSRERRIAAIQSASKRRWDRWRAIRDSSISGNSSG